MPSLLVVDDTPIIRSTITRVVERDCLPFAPVMQASNGLEAVALAEQAQPEVVLIDIKMPGLDGLQASSIIREKLPHTKIIFLTAYDEFSYVQRALKLGAADYLLKPIRPAKLTETLTQVCEQLACEKPRSAGDTNAALPDVPPACREPIQHALDYIQRNQQRPDLSLAEVAEHVNLSPSHLAHMLKEHVGLGYKQYLTAQRIAAAKKLLHTTDLTVEAVAEAVGYQNCTNFYRLFQRETGATPAAFRRSA